MSGGLNKQDGIVVYDNDRYQRLNFRTNINAGLSAVASTSEPTSSFPTRTQDKLSSKGDAPGIIRHALIRPPIIAVYKDPSRSNLLRGRSVHRSAFLRDAVGQQQQPVRVRRQSGRAGFLHQRQARQLQDVRQRLRRILADADALKFRSNVGLDLSLRHNKALNQNFGDNNGGGNATRPGNGPPESSDRLERGQGTGNDGHLEQHPELRQRTRRSTASPPSSAASTSRTTRPRSADRDSGSTSSSANFQYLNYGGTLESEHRRIGV